MLATLWVVLANSSQAEIYSTLKKAQPSIQHIETLIHSDSRKKGRELATDKLGHYQTPGATRGAYSGHHELKEIERDKFAQEITHYLEKNLLENKFQQFILVVGPDFYGYLNQHFDKSLKKNMKKVIQKEMIFQHESELKEYILSIL